jgi:outer membrane protein assembly factor BamA
MFLASSVALAAPTGEIVRAIEIRGAKKMRVSRVLQYMDTKVGGDFDPDVLTRDVETIRSWMYFEYVRPTVMRAADGVRIAIEIKEKWTIIPELDAQYGGGAYLFKLGIKDTNFLGYRQEAMAYGGYRAGDWLAGMRFIEPRIAGSRFGLRFEAMRTFYADPVYVSPNDHPPAYELVLDSLGGELRLEREFSRVLRAGIAYGYARDRAKRSPDSRSERPPAGAFPIPEESTSAYAALWMKAGRVVFDQYLYRGVSLESTLRLYDPALGASESFERLTADFRFYVPVPGRMNATGRLLIGAETSQDLTQQFTIGGLDTLRGYPDRRYRGRDLAAANFEYRWVAGSWWWFTYMFLAMADVATTWNGAADSWSTGDDLHASAGLGFRWIAHKWDNAVVRIDVAWPMADPLPIGFTFGVDMFF